MRPSHLLAIATSLLIATLPTIAAGQTRYRWVDDQGHKHLSDEVPADAVRFGYDVLNPYGRVIRHVEGAKTPEQLAEQKRQAEERKKAEDQKRYDQNLLLTYPSEQDLVTAQTNQVTMTQQRIDSTRINMKSQLDALASLLDQAAQLQQNNKPVPHYLKDKIDKQRGIIRDQREWIERTESKLEQTRKDNADILKRYRAASTSRYPHTGDDADSPDLN